MPMWGATARRGRAPRGRFSRRPRAAPARRRIMGNFLSMAAYNAAGGFLNRYKRKRTSSKKGVLKKTSSKKKYKKTFKGKSKTVPDQRWTRMEYEDTHSGSGSAQFTGNSNVRYIGYQTTGGMIPLTRAVAGSIVRDILSKNGVKYATWNSSAEGSVGGADIWRQRIGKIKFYFRGQGVSGELVDRDNYQKDGVTTDTEVQTYTTSGVYGTLRSLWDITEEVRVMFVDCASRGFYPVSYEVLTYTESAWVVKFRDPNFGMSSVNMQVMTDLCFTNQTPANAATTTDAQYDTNRTDTVQLKCKQYKFRNLAPFFRDDLLTATTKSLPDGSAHPFSDIHLSQKMDYDQGILNLSYWHDNTEKMFRPLTSAPNGAVVFKNLAFTSDCGIVGPGRMTKKKLMFKYNGGLRSLLVQVIPQTKYCDPDTPTSSSTDVDAKALLNRVSKGDSVVYAFSRVKNLNVNTLGIPDVLVARKISTSCYVQPFKSAPLPVCRNPSSNFSDDPGYD